MFDASANESTELKIRLFATKRPIKESNKPNKLVIKNAMNYFHGFFQQNSVVNKKNNFKTDLFFA